MISLIQYCLLWEVVIIVIIIVCRKLCKSLRPFSERLFDSKPLALERHHLASSSIVVLLSIVLIFCQRSKDSILVRNDISCSLFQGLDLASVEFQVLIKTSEGVRRFQSSGLNQSLGRKNL